MEDIPSTTSGEQTFVNPQLDTTITTPKQKQKLNESFNSFWETEDAKLPTASELPKEVQETKEEKEPEEPKEVKEEPKEEPKVEGEKEEPKETKEEPKVETPKDELDALEPHPAATEENKSHFKQLKEAAKALKEKNKVWEKIAPALQELGYSISDNPEELSKTLEEAVTKIRSLKTGVMAPEVQAELDHLRVLARSVGVLKSEEFTKEYVQPVETAYLDVIEEMSHYFDAPPETIKSEFLDPLKKDFRPHQLKPEWWDTQLELMTKAPASIKRKIENKVATVLQLQDRHDKRARELAENPESYASWAKQNEEVQGRIYEATVRDQVEKERAERKEIASIMPQSVDGITDAEKLEKIKKHNAAFPEKEALFRSVLSDFRNGPRSGAKRALEFVLMQDANNALKDSVDSKDEEIANLKESTAAELKALKEERDKLRSEVSQKRKLSDIPTKPQAGTGAKPTPEKAALPKDARKSLSRAFDDWKL